MAENLFIAEGGKSEKYEALIPQVKALIEGENDWIAKLANIAAALKQTFDFYWVGFYRVVGEELILGPFQGPVACTRIRKGKGVCGTAWAKQETILVPDVDLFPGHIACSSASRSEVVVPVIDEGNVCAVLDIDSDRLNAFTAEDAYYLEQLVKLLKED